MSSNPQAVNSIQNNIIERSNNVIFVRVAGGKTKLSATAAVETAGRDYRRRDYRNGGEMSNLTYNSCGICGRAPKDREEPNHAPIKWWDPDDGWKIGTLCRWCIAEFKDVLPSPEDYAYGQSMEYAEIETDEDPLEAL